jgi:hypothetical protein
MVHPKKSEQFKLGHYPHSAYCIAGVRPSPGATTTKLKNRHQSSETAGYEFVAVAGDGHTPDLENKPRGYAHSRAPIVIAGLHRASRSVARQGVLTYLESHEEK